MIQVFRNRYGRLAVAGVIAVAVVLATYNVENGRAATCELNLTTVLASAWKPSDESCAYGRQYGWPFTWKQLEFAGASDAEAISGSLAGLDEPVNDSNGNTYPLAIALNLLTFTFVGFLMLSGLNLLLKRR